jgi:thiol-disulfide isomerase/thioredoxin
MSPPSVLVLTLVASTALGLWLRVRSGRLAAAAPAAPPFDAEELARLGGSPGERATLVQFASAFCQPCRATRQILGDVAATVEGVGYVEVDAESHLDAVRRHAIFRTPTTLVLDRAGHVVVRATGQPRKADVLAAVGRAIDGSTTPQRHT